MEYEHQEKEKEWMDSLLDAPNTPNWRVTSSRTISMEENKEPLPNRHNTLQPLLAKDTVLVPQNNDSNYRKMESFPLDHVSDFKHVLYNLLVENHNNPLSCSFLQPIVVRDEKTGRERHGFRFNPMDNPDKKLPELYAHHIKGGRLDWEDSSSIFIQDLYRYYLRACVELMSKYFEKKDKFTYLYDKTPLFIPNESLKEAEERLKSMKSRYRSRGKRKNPESED